MSGGSKPQTTGYWYGMTMHMGLCAGPVDYVRELRAGDRVAWTGNVTTNTTVSVYRADLFGGEEKEGGLHGSFDVMMGAPDQGANARLSAAQTGPQPGYRGILSVVWAGLLAANNPYIKAFSWKLTRCLKGWQNEAAWYPAKAAITFVSGDVGMNPAHIAYECITNQEWGMGYSAAMIDDANFRAAADTFHAEGMGLCLLWTRQAQIQQFLQTVMNHAGANLGQDRRTGLFIIKPLRGDYDVEDLQVFDPSNVLSLDSYQRPGIPDAVNEVTVTYTDVTTGLNAGVTVQNLANITAQGGVVNEPKKYPGIPTGDLAARIAMRDLLAVSTPLAKVRMQVNRSGYSIIPGDVIRLSWPKLGITNLVLRVLTAGAGTITDGAITLECAEDVFGLPSSAYTAQQSSGWVEPSTEPLPIANRVVQEAGYFQLRRVMTPGDFATVTSDAGYLATVCSRPSPDAVNYRIAQRFVSSGAFADGGPGDFCPSGALSAALSVSATSLTLTSLVDAELIEVNTYAYLGAEVVRIDTFNIATGAVTIGRGCLDTVAAPHAMGDRLFFAQDYESGDGIERVDGDVVQAKLLTRTGRGTLAEADAPTDSVTMDQRQFRPYPPGRVRVAGAVYPTTVSGPAVVTWAHRNRLQQNLEGDETGNIGPEAGTTYNVRFYDNGTNTLRASATGLTGTTYTVNVTGTFTGRLEIESVRDGLTSRQKHALVFAYAKASDNLITEAGDNLLTEAGDDLITE